MERIFNYPQVQKLKHKAVRRWCLGGEGGGHACEAPNCACIQTTPVCLATMRRNAGTKRAGMSHSPIVISSDSSSGSGSDSDDSVVFVGSKKPKTGGASVLDTGTYRSTPFVPHVSALEGLFAQAKSNPALGGKVRAIMQSNAVATPARLPLPPASPLLRGSSISSISSASSSYASSRSSESSSSSASSASSRRFPLQTIRFHVQDVRTPYSKDLSESDLTDKNDAILRIDNNYTKEQLNANLELLFPDVHYQVKVYPPSSNEKLYEPEKHFIFVTVFTDKTETSEKYRDIPRRITSLKDNPDFEKVINVFYYQDADSLEKKTETPAAPSAASVPEPPIPAAAAAAGPAAQTISYTVDNSSEIKVQPYVQKPTDAVEIQQYFQNLPEFRNKTILVKQNKKCFVDVGKKADGTFRTDPSIQISKPFNVTVVPELYRYLSERYHLQKVYANPNALFKGMPHYNMCLYHALSIASTSAGNQKTPSDMKEAAIAQLQIQLGQLQSNLGSRRVTLPQIIASDVEGYVQNYVYRYPLVQGMLESGIDDANEYIRFISQSGTMGGEPEILCISKNLGPRFVIVEYMKQSYDKCQSDKEFNDLHRWVMYFSDGKRLDNYVEQPDKIYLRMLYTGGHYDALLPN
jgi:hypothetical protein